MNDTGILFIPDGMRRYAKAKSLTLTETYCRGAEQMFQVGIQLLERTPLVGLFPLARYNLKRSNEEIMPLLTEGCNALSRFLDINNNSTQIYVIGDANELCVVHPAFRMLLQRCNVNPQLLGMPIVGSRTLVLYLAYEGIAYIEQLMDSNGRIRRDLAPTWNTVFRTGCPDGAFRLSETFVGIEQAYLAGSRDVFLDCSAESIVAECSKIATMRLC